MGGMYTILINDDHSFTHTDVKRIMHRSNMIDTLRFLVKPVYNGLDMTKVNAMLEIVTPASRTYIVRKLQPSTELYKNRVEYLLPIDLDLTSEPGELEFTINFSYLSKDDSGNFIEQVRPIGYTSIKIEDTVRWSDYIADSRLDNIAQIMMTNQAIAEQNSVNIELMKDMMGTSLKHNKEDNTLHLVNEDGIKVGEAVSTDEFGGDCGCEDGVPVVELTVVEPEEGNGSFDNVVEI